MPTVADTLAALVAIDSVNPAYPTLGGAPGPGESAVAAWVEAFLVERGIRTVVQGVLPGRANVLGVVPGRDDGRRVVLEAHMDTVSPAGMTIAPFAPRVADGRLHGRGACDVKGGLAAMLHALVDLAAGPPPPAEVVLAAVIDEEHAFRGVSRLVEHLRAAAAVVAEPTDLRIVTATKGVLRFRIHVHGRAAHTSKPWLGANAVVQGARVVLALDALHATLAARTHALLGSATGTVSMIAGGVQINIVPETCTLAVDRRLLPAERAADALDEYRQVLTAVESVPGCRIEVEEPFLVDEALDTPADRPAVAAARDVASRLGLDGQIVGVPYGSDASKFARAGVDALVFGPGSIDQAHAADEFVDITALETARGFYREWARAAGERGRA
ncbi:MAG: M20 family metallopeptidase [Planctomycetes bacterium]|nr:M20 family metallopeptidase [Planctomycetota bacterium]